VPLTMAAGDGGVQAEGERERRGTSHRRISLCGPRVYWPDHVAKLFIKHEMNW